MTVSRVTVREIAHEMLWFSRSFVAASVVLAVVVSIANPLGSPSGLNLFGLDSPLRGLASHANVFGSVAAFGFLLEISTSKSRMKWAWQVLFVCGLVL